MSTESRIEAFIMYSNGEIDRDCSTAGMIYGVHYCKVEEILEEVYNYFNDWFSDYIGDSDDFLSGSGAIDYTIKDISWDDGQQSFPESGLWDYLPHWEFRIEITRHEKWDDVDEDHQDSADKSDIDQTPF